MSVKPAYRRKVKARRLDIDIDAVDWDQKLRDVGITIHYDAIPDDVTPPLLLPAYCRYKKEQNLYLSIEKPTKSDKNRFKEANLELKKLSQKVEEQEDSVYRNYMEAFKLYAEVGGNRLADETKPINERIAKWFQRKEEGKSKIRKGIETIFGVSLGAGGFEIAQEQGVGVGPALVFGTLLGYAFIASMDIGYEYYVDWQLKRLGETKGEIYFETLSTFAVGLNQFFEDSVDVKRDLGKILKDIKKKRKIISR